MVQALVAAAVVVGLTARPADDGAKKTPADPVQVLRDRAAAYGGDVRATPLTDVLRDLARAHDLTFIIDNSAFENPGAVGEAKAVGLAAAGLAKLPLGRFLDVYLAALGVPEGVTYLARPEYVEITSTAKARAEDKKDATADGAAKLVKLLNNTPVTLGELDLQTAPFVDVMREMARRYDVTFIIDSKAFENPAVLADAKAGNLSAARLEGLTLGQFLNVYLRALPVPEEVTYLVRSWGIEITSRQKAQEEAGLVEAQESAGENPSEQAAVRARARLPLVSVVADDRPLAEVFKELARAYNLNLVIDRPVRNRVGDAAVSARLLNVPADTALELLAEQAELSVVRKGNTFRITAGGGAQ